MLAPAQEQIPMNRTQRRAAEKAAKRKPPAATKRFASQKEAYAHLLKPIALLNDCRPFREGEVDLDIVKVRFAYDRLKDGMQTKTTFCLLAWPSIWPRFGPWKSASFLPMKSRKPRTP